MVGTPSHTYRKAKKFMRLIDVDKLKKVIETERDLSGNSWFDWFIQVIDEQPIIMEQSENTEDDIY